jgi:3-O-methylgallate 3,4-dioxygenase
MLDAMQRKDVEAIMALPQERMVQGTSELRNWITAAGSLEPLKMTLLNYIQAPRTLAATGLAFGFAYWEQDNAFGRQ